jgi:bifunctional non-homologous end joining protein LigD
MRPMFATPGPLPLGGQWRYEVRWAGLRVLAEVTGGALRLTTPDEREVTAHFPEFAELAGRLRDAVLDGEIIMLDGGVPSAAALARRLGGGRSARAEPTAFMVFDVLRLYGVPLLQRPLDERRATLERVRVDAADNVTLSPVYDDGPALLTATRRHGLRGVVAKLAGSPYRPGVRDPSWIEVGAA